MTNKKHKTRTALLVVVTLLTGVTTYLAQSTRKDEVLARQIIQPALTEKANQERVRNSVVSLLSRSGIKLGSSLALADAQTHRELRIHWQSFGKAESPSPALLNEQQLASGSGLTRKTSTVRTGALPRERSFELSTDHIFVVGVDEHDAVRWWRLIADPRLVRAEVGRTTEMQSQNYYLSNADLVVECPDDPVLKQLRLYRPLWNGQEFQLELIGAVALQ
jgi:hypothetical protein